MEKLNTQYQTNWLLYLMAIGSLVLYLVFSYFIERVNFEEVVLIYSLLFALFISMYILYAEKHWKILLGLALLYRLAHLFQTPNLSNDFYRFIFDGRLIFNGFNPFLYIPNEFISAHEISNGKELVSGMGSLNASHYSCYPTIKQFVFYLAALVSQKNILGANMVMRLVIIIADLGTMFFALKILKKIKIPQYNIILYALNPFIILELTANLHFEGLMVFFFTLGIYCLQNNQLNKSAISIACAIMVKLIPLIFLPSILTHILQKSLIKIKATEFKFKLLFKTMQQTLIYCSIVFLGILLLLAPFLSDRLIVNFMDSIQLYFTNFEFNASIYFLLRELGFFFKGYNIIHITGKILPIVVFSIILLLSVIRKNNKFKILLSSLFFSNVIYLFFATTVHPWYLVTPLLLSIFTQYKFVLVWTYFVIFSYKAYSVEPFQENLVLIFLEYLIVFLVLLYEVYPLFRRKQTME